MPGFGMLHSKDWVKISLEPELVPKWLFYAKSTKLLFSINTRKIFDLYLFLVVFNPSMKLKVSISEGNTWKMMKISQLLLNQLKKFIYKSGLIFGILCLFSAKNFIWKILTLGTWRTSRFEPNDMRPSQKRFFWPCLSTL